MTVVAYLQYVRDQLGSDGLSLTDDVSTLGCGNGCSQDVCFSYVSDINNDRSSSNDIAFQAGLLQSTVGLSQAGPPKVGVSAPDKKLVEH